jgi:hypothetical protein
MEDVGFRRNPTRIRSFPIGSTDRIGSPGREGTSKSILNYSAKQLFNLVLMIEVDTIGSS